MSRSSDQAPIYDKLKSFINFDSLYDSTFSIIFIITIFAVLIFFIRKYFPKKSDYHSQEYWENRYSLFSKNMDWYGNFEKIKTDFKLNEILDKYYPKKNKTKILELGCGNSSLAFDFYNYGYKNITSIDFSNVIINQMKEKYFTSSLNFVQCDFTRMNEKFKENSFDLIIEKAGLDSIATKMTPDTPYQLRSTFSQIYSVLKPGGFLLSFSIKNPEFWNSNVFDQMAKSNMFQVVQQVVTVFTVEKNPTLMNLYFYHLRSLKE